jgi:hypothetical protein
MPSASRSSPRSQGRHAGEGAAEEVAVNRVEDEGEHDRTPCLTEE